MRVFVLPQFFAHRRREDDERVVLLSMDVKKDKELRTMLLEFGVPTTGDKATLLARVQQWVFFPSAVRALIVRSWALLWNANLDCSKEKRKSRSELVKELKREVGSFLVIVTAEQ